MQRYALIERMAVGGMGEVFLARQQGIGGFARTVVLKRLLPELEHDELLANRLLDEARVVAALTHDNVVSIVEVVQEQQQRFLVLEYVHGENAGTLKSRAKKRDLTWPFQVAARVVADAARGLHHAHTAKDASGRALSIVHRDVSPKNLFVRIDGVTKVGDFGVAHSDRQMSETQTGAVPGTLSYMSPEQARGEVVTGLSDQFSLGIVLWELLTLQSLFRQEQLQATLRALSHKTVEPPSKLRADAAVLDAVVLRMLSRDPAKRFSSMHDVALAIDDAVPSCRGVAGADAVAAFLQLVAGDELAKRDARIQQGPSVALHGDLTGSYSWSAPVVSLGSAIHSASTALHADGLPSVVDTNGHDTEAVSEGAAVSAVTARASAPRVVRGASRAVAPLTQQRAPARPKSRALFAMVAAVVVAALTATTIVLTRPSDDDVRTRAYLAHARDQDAFINRAVFLAMAQQHHLDMQQADEASRTLAALLTQRLEVLVAHYAQSERTRAAQQLKLQRTEDALLVKAHDVLVPFGPAFAAEALDMWDYDSGAPRRWQPPSTLVELQQDIAAGGVEFMNEQQQMRQDATQWMLAQSNASGLYEPLHTLAIEREKRITQLAVAPPQQLEALQQAIRALQAEGERLLAVKVGAARARAIASVAFHLVSDDWQAIHDYPPSTRYRFADVVK